jgi:hypothetical protein
VTRFWGFAALILVGFLMFATPNIAMAHKMDSALSTINVSENGAVEITHRIFAHDIEHQFELSNIGMDYFETAAGQQQIETYLRQAFVFNDGQNQPIALSFVGAQIEGDLLYVYFEGQIAQNREFMIDSNILNLFSATQTNFVNLHFGEITKSIVFSGGQGETRISLGQ